MFLLICSKFIYLFQQHKINFECKQSTLKGPSTSSLFLTQGLLFLQIKHCGYCLFSGGHGGAWWNWHSILINSTRFYHCWSNRKRLDSWFYSRGNNSLFPKSVRGEEAIIFMLIVFFIRKAMQSRQVVKSLKSAVLHPSTLHFSATAHKKVMYYLFFSTALVVAFCN